MNTVHKPGSLLKTQMYPETPGTPEQRNCITITWLFQRGTQCQDHQTIVFAQPWARVHSIEIKSSKYFSFLVHYHWISLVPYLQNVSLAYFGDCNYMPKQILHNFTLVFCLQTEPCDYSDKTLKNISTVKNSWGNSKPVFHSKEFL